MAADFSHHLGLMAGYGIAIAASLTLALTMKCRKRPLYPAVDPPRFAHPWREFALALLACIGIIGVGQVYVHLWRIPTDGPLGWLAEAINQLAIFSPILVLLALRPYPRESIFLAQDRLPLRLAVGVIAGVLGVIAYALVQLNPTDVHLITDAFARTDNIPHLVQVLLEDIVIICLIARLGAALRSLFWAGLIVVTLFVAGHIPTILATDDFTAQRALQLLLDVGIGIIVLAGLLRLRDLLWFWPLHLAMDLTQFIELPA